MGDYNCLCMYKVTSICLIGNKKYLFQKKINTLSNLRISWLSVFQQKIREQGIYNFIKDLIKGK